MSKHDERHGGAYDRGRADFWYGRPYDPHCYADGTYTSDRIEAHQLTANQLKAYRDGYADAEAAGDQKDWGE